MQERRGEMVLALKSDPVLPYRVFCLPPKEGVGWETWSRLLNTVGALLLWLLLLVPAVQVLKPSKGRESAQCLAWSWTLQPLSSYQEVLESLQRKF